MVLALLSPFPHTASADVAQRIELPSSPNPVGSGARALGMGGAFIAIADDATAASWNPGGLIQLEYSEISIVGAYLSRNEDNSLSYNQSHDSETIDFTALNYLSATYPFSLLGHSMILSASYQYLFDFRREGKFTLQESNGNFSVNENHRAIMEGNLSALGIAYCLELTPKLSAGFTINIWDDPVYGNEWELNAVTQGQGQDVIDGVMQPFDFTSHGYSRYEFSGLNANIGLLWRISNSITLGVVYKTPFRADLEHEEFLSVAISYPNRPDLNTSYTLPYSPDMRLDMPASYGIGIAWRYNDAFTLSGDIYRTEWNRFALIDPSGEKTSPITLNPLSQSDVDATTQLRAGMEYAWITERYTIPFRFGLFYDPAPAEGNPDDYYGFSLGTGIAFTRIVFDMAYQYRFGNDVGKSMLQPLGFSQDMKEHMVLSSVIVYF